MAKSEMLILSEAVLLYKAQLELSKDELETKLELIRLSNKLMKHPEDCGCGIHEMMESMRRNLADCTKELNKIREAISIAKLEVAEETGEHPHIEIG